MNKLLTILAFGMLSILYACEKEKMEVPGDIPGMGNAEGELEVQEAFVLPEGIELVGSLYGFGENESQTSINMVELNSINGSNAILDYKNYGSGIRNVILKCELKNNTNYIRTVFFPKGLMCKVNKEGYQNGMLLQWTWVSIPPQTIKEFVLHLYCVNRGKHDSDASTDYTFYGVTGSPVMWKLLNKIGWRKINYEHYYAYNTTSNVLKEEDVSYNDIAKGLQEAIWSLTNGEGLSEEQTAFIESLPILEEGTYPVELENETLQAPYYFEEYSPVE